MVILSFEMSAFVVKLHHHTVYPLNPHITQIIHYTRHTRLQFTYPFATEWFCSSALLHRNNSSFNSKYILCKGIYAVMECNCGYIVKYAICIVSPQLMRLYKPIPSSTEPITCPLVNRMFVNGYIRWQSMYLRTDYYFHLVKNSSIQPYLHKKKPMRCVEPAVNVDPISF